MTAGTIHPLGEDLFVIEGEPPSPSAAVYRSGRRLYLLDTGCGPAQRGAVRAVVASYGRVEELVLLSSSADPRPGSNDDLVDELPAQQRVHLQPRPAHPDRQGAPRTAPRCYDALEGPGSVMIGSEVWPGWTLADRGLDVLRIGMHGRERIAFHLASARALILPDLLHLPTQDVARSGAVEAATQLVRLLDASSVMVVVVGSGRPQDRTQIDSVLLAMSTTQASAPSPV